MIHAAGILFVAGDRVLLLRRSGEGDHAGEWSLPGGKIEDGETPEQAAVRECREEIGKFPDGKRMVLLRQRLDDVDYTTFVQNVSEEFSPELNEEHDSYDWLSVGESRSDDATFAEADHPRDEDGKFTEGSSSGASSSRENLKPTRIEGGKRVTASGAPLPPHIEKLKVPPGWTDVRFNENPEGSLLAVGKDSKGRVQSVYSKEFTETNAAAKFERIHDLMEKFQEISQQNHAAQNADNPKLRDSADCLDLIMKMGVRPGSETDTGAKVQAYGATTLRGEHVVKTENGVSLRFVGKKGVSLDLAVHDPQLAAMLLRRSAASGASGKLFPRTDDKALLDHVHTLDGGGFKTKDFRTHVGTSTAYSLVAQRPVPKNETEYKRAVMDVAKEVSQKLGNTPIIALQSYISPTVFAEWRAAL